MRKLILTYSTPKARSKFALRGAEFCSINLARETTWREILLYGFWNFKFSLRALTTVKKTCGLRGALKFNHFKIYAAWLV